jgi:molecular chaperone DnaJ
MPQKNYYLILGIPRTETAHGIQKAFRKLAKQHHPDRMGPHGTAAFQEIVEAYETLSDPGRRREYDDQLLDAETLTQSPPEPIIPQAWPRPEPLIPEPLSVGHDFATLRPSLGALRARLLRNFTGRGIPKGERLEGLNVEVQLSPEEAIRGGVIRIGVPVFTPCTLCLGAGRNWGFLCPACMGQGIVEDEGVVAVRIPPRVPQGTILEVPLRGLGLRNFYLRLHIHVTWA